MERFCGHLLPAVKNRVRPYEHLDNYVQRRAQMQIVSKVHDLPSLARPFVNYRYENGTDISSRETTYPECKFFFALFREFVYMNINNWFLTVTNIVLGTPVNRTVPLTTQLLNQLTRFFGAFHQGVRVSELQKRIEPHSIIRYGRFRMTGDGDRIRTAALIDNDPIARDNSYVKVHILLIHLCAMRY
jgi:hypothetical protein